MQWISQIIKKLNLWRSTKSYTGIKWLFLFCVAILALRLFDLEEVYQNVLQLSLQSIIIALILLALARLTYNMRLYLLLSGLNLRNIPFLLLLRTNLLAEFISIVMPSYLGGDGIRWIKLEKYVEQPGTMATAILLDRIIGLGTLVLTMVLVSWNIASMLEFSISFSTLVIIIICIGFLITGIFIARITFVQEWINKRVISKGMKPINIFGAILLSIIGHLIFAIAYYVLLNDLISVAFLPVISITIVAFTTRIIPISLLGIEATDGSFIALANLAGINDETAIVVVITIIATRYIFALLGILLEVLVSGHNSLNSLRKRQP